MKKMFLIALTWLAVCATALVHAAAGVAVFDERSALRASDYAKAELAKLDADIAPLQTQLDGIRQSINELEARFKVNQSKLSASEREAMQHQAEEKLDAYNAVAERIQVKIETAQNSIAKVLQPKVKAAVNRIQAERGIGVVVDRSAVYAADDTLDITKDVTRILNQKTQP